MIHIEFTEEAIKELHDEHLYNPHPRVRQRCAVVYLKALGFSHQEIGRITRLSQPTIRSYLGMYREGGLEKLKELNFSAPTSELDEHCEMLKAEFEAHPPGTINEAIERIEKLTGLRRSPTQVREFLKNLGMKRLKVGHIPAKADPSSSPRFWKKSSNPAWRKPSKASGTCSSWMPRISCFNLFSAFCGASHGSSFRPPAVGSA